MEGIILKITIEEPPWEYTYPGGGFLFNGSIETKMLLDKKEVLLNHEP